MPVIQADVGQPVHVAPLCGLDRRISDSLSCCPLFARMARFETWGDVARLFIGAACVGVLLILLLTAEARKLEEREDALVAMEEEEAESDKVVPEAGDISALTGLRTVWSKVAQFIRFLISDTLLTGDVFILSQDL